MKKATASQSLNTIRLPDKGLLIGIAGYMGSGKSTCARYLCDAGAVIIDADKEAKKLEQSDRSLQAKLSDAFGNEIIIENRIRFDLLGQRAFDTLEHLQLLNSIVHPVLVRHLEICVKNEQTRTCILDAALIPLWHIETWFDTLIWVDCRRDLRAQRIHLKHPELTLEAIDKRMLLQEQSFAPPDNNKWNIVTNNSSIDELCGKIVSMIS